MLPLEDHKLLSAIQTGSEKAFDMLFRKYYPALCAYSHKMVSLEDAEECAQDTLLWLWENRESVIIQSSLSHYLFAAVYHRSLNRISQQETKIRAEKYFSQEFQELILDAGLFQIEELQKQIQEAILRLPSSYREAFIMHRFHDMSYKEIAVQLNISPKTVDYRIQQALKQLRIELKNYLPLIYLLFTWKI